MEGILDTISTLLFWFALAAGTIFTALHGGAIVWAFRDMRARSRDMLAGIHADKVPRALKPVLGDRFPVEFIQTVESFHNR